MDPRRKFVQPGKDIEREMKLEQPDIKHTQTEKPNIISEKIILDDEQVTMEDHIFFMRKTLDRYSNRCAELKVFFEVLKKETTEKFSIFEKQLEEQKNCESKGNENLLKLEKQKKIENLDSRISALESYKNKFESESSDKPSKAAELKDFIKKKSLKLQEEEQERKFEGMSLQMKELKEEVRELKEEVRKLKEGQVEEFKICLHE
ncbi:hypothetical protein SteCoe_38899 [Stentor coeruleus]|uniref:Uncharacterized protein n=1 Tax=Stentor coeruleus TaxID=5963 RepID=A0A1R2AL11_9CILI|nr:hypothetical protein SteCoe_38899 [Stentor coeruleus]